jgi:restriction endonuclease S subunit
MPPLTTERLVTKHIIKRINKHLEEIHALIDKLNNPKEMRRMSDVLFAGRITPIDLKEEE